MNLKKRKVCIYKKGYKNYNKLNSWLMYYQNKRLKSKNYYKLKMQKHQKQW